jgi:hypothetical protein
VAQKEKRAEERPFWKALPEMLVWASENGLPLIAKFLESIDIPRGHDRILWALNCRVRTSNVVRIRKYVIEQRKRVREINAAHRREMNEF